MKRPVNLDPVLHIPIKEITLEKLREKRMLWHVNNLVNEYLDELVGV